MLNYNIIKNRGATFRKQGNALIIYFREDFIRKYNFTIIYKNFNTCSIHKDLQMHFFLVHIKGALLSRYLSLSSGCPVKALLT